MNARQLLLAVLLAVTSSGNLLAGTNLSGSWEGALDAGAAKLRVVFHLTDISGQLAGTMDSPDQGARGIPVGKSSLTNQNVRLEVAAVGGFFEGVISSNASQVVGAWSQAGMKFPLTLVRTSPDAGAPPRDFPWEKFAREFVDQLVRQDFENATARFDRAMKSAAPPAKLKEVWAGQLKIWGAVKTIRGSRTETFAPYHFVFVSCEFERQPADIKVVLDAEGRIAGMFFVSTQEGSAKYQAPSYEKSGTFIEKEVTIGTGEWRLPGTLALPKAGGKHRSVVLVHGSGSTSGDRDETIGPNKPLRDLAAGLASRGVAVLRYEKRTKHHAAKLAAVRRFTVEEETIEDALQAVALLRRTESIEAGQVYVLGHSLGGYLAPRMAKEGSGIAGLIIMAGAARPLEDLMLEQVEFQRGLQPQAGGSGVTLDAISKQVRLIKTLSPTNVPAELILGAPAAYWLDLQGYDPVKCLRDLPMPALILQGSKDCQVSARHDLGRWREFLADRGNVRFKEYPGLNHLFIPVAGQSTGAEYAIPGNVAAVVIEDIAAFVLRD